MQVFKHHWLLKIQFQSTRLNQLVTTELVVQCYGKEYKNLEKREVRSHNKVRLSARTFSQK